jgi:hypothetical protein
MSWLAVMVLVFVVGPALGWGWRSGRPRRRGRWDSDGQLGARYDELIGELDRRTTMIEQLEGRVAELENRLDFTERMLASPRLRPTQLTSSTADNEAGA